MKKRAILSLLGLIISSSFVFCQVSKDTLQEENVYPQLYGSFSEEEILQIRKEAYKKQLEAKGSSEKKVNKQMLQFDKRKNLLIYGIKNNRIIDNKERQLAEIESQKADEQSKLAEIESQKADEQSKLADKQWEFAEVQRQKAMELRKLADKQRALAKSQNYKAYASRREADRLRKSVDERRKHAEALRKSIKKLYYEEIVISNKNTKSVDIQVTKSNTLFFNINGRINSGNTLIEIFNPKGKKVGELSLEHRKNLNPSTGSIYSDKTSGSLNKTINAPEIGDWLIKITPKNSNGNVNISVAQYVKTAIDE